MYKIKIRQFKYKLQDSTASMRKKLNLDRKTLFLYAGAVFLPLALLLLFAMSDFNFGNLKSNLSLSFSGSGVGQQQTESDPKNTFDLRLIPRDDFLQNYSVMPSFLPNVGRTIFSLSDVLDTNSAEVLLPARNWEVEFEDIVATSVLAIDVERQRVLYGKNVFDVRPVASLTKLATALVAVENIPLDTVITVTLEAIMLQGNSANLVAGAQLTLQDLLYAMLLESSNDAAGAIEIYYNQTKASGAPDFVTLMNSKMQELGISSTSFVEPSGLNDENVSTAYGVAKLLSAAYENPTLAQVMSSSSYTVRPKNKEMVHFWVNNNALLDAYEGIVGGKTGYTEAAGPSMSIVAETPNKSGFMVLVVLDAENRIEALSQLYEWVQKAYIWEE